MKINRAGIELIKEFEGLRLEAYKCPAGVWTIGYGHTSAAGPPAVTSGMKITADEAADILVVDLVKYETAVMNALKRSPNENQFSAMVSLCYNIGPKAFATSTVVRKFNAGDVEGAAAAFRLWKKSKGEVLTGLVRRRQVEIDLFCAPIEQAKTSNLPAFDSGKSIAAWLLATAAALIAALATWIMKG